MPAVRIESPERDIAVRNNTCVIYDVFASTIDDEIGFRLRPIARARIKRAIHLRLILQFRVPKERARSGKSTRLAAEYCYSVGTEEMYRMAASLIKPVYMA